MLIKYNSQNDTIDWRDTRICKELALEKLLDGEIDKIIWYEGDLPKLVHKDGFLTVFKYNANDGLYITYEALPEIDYDDNQQIMQSLSDLEIRILELTTMIKTEDN